MTIIKTYSDLIALPTYEERLQFLQMSAKVGEATFGSHRHMNQSFYRSDLWKGIRDRVIVRDNGCDLGVDGYEIHDRIIIHHITPITAYDSESETELLTDLENLISSSLYTHNKIHYGVDSKDPFTLNVRTRNDTCPWRR